MDIVSAPDPELRISEFMHVIKNVLIARLQQGTFWFLALLAKHVCIVPNVRCSLLVLQDITSTLAVYAPALPQLCKSSGVVSS
jgi:hypothetical protein